MSNIAKRWPRHRAQTVRKPRAPAGTDLDALAVAVAVVMFPGLVLPVLAWILLTRPPPVVIEIHVDARQVHFHDNRSVVMR